MLLEPAVFVSAALLGLAGAGHCFAMCGGITSALGIMSERKSIYHSIGSSLLYSLGRISSYTAIGVLVGLGAALVPGTGWPVARSFAALCLLLMGVYFLGWKTPILGLEKVGRPFWQWLQPLNKKLLPVDHPAKVFFIGALWGWLPCGLVYTALTYAAAQGNPVTAGAVMLSFGIGTLPAMLLTGLVAKQLQQILQKRLIVGLIGGLYILFAFWTLYFAWYHVLLHAPSAAGQAEQHIEHSHH